MTEHLPFPHYFDKSGALRVFRKQQPSSPARLERWSLALRNAHDNRAHAVKIVCQRDEHGEPIGKPERIKRPEIDFKTLLVKIERQSEEEVKRGGHQESVLSAVKHALGGQDAYAAASMRSHIIDLAIVGQLTPEEAETWALRLGLQQIAKRNGRDLCNPMQVDQWSLLMAAIWIRWRDLRLVARVSPDSKNFLPQWVEIEHEDGSTGFDIDPDDDLEDVKRELADYLGSSVSLASGVRDGERRQIGAVEWTDLKIVGTLEGEGFASVMLPGGERDIYERVRLSRVDLLAAFPPLASGAEDPAPSVETPEPAADALAQVAAAAIGVADAEPARVDATIPRKTVSHTPRPRGKPPKETERIIERMQEFVARGENNLELLKDMTGEVMRSEFKEANLDTYPSRYTCQKARDYVVSEFSGNE